MDTINIIAYNHAPFQGTEAWSILFTFSCFLILGAGILLSLYRKELDNIHKNVPQLESSQEAKVNSKPIRKRLALNHACIDNHISHETLKRRHSVSFSKLEIREYNVIIGDSPSCSTGLPLSLGWEHTNTRALCVNVFENTRPMRRYGQKELILNPAERKRLLRDVGGYSNFTLKLEEEKLRLKRNNSV